jgi:hypothetical protein
VAGQDGQRGERGGGDHAQREDQQQQQPAHLPGREAGPVLAWDVPDLGHGVLAGLGHPAGAPQEYGQADDQPHGVGAQPSVSTSCETLALLE